jgi:hypothetical protein
MTKVFQVDTTAGGIFAVAWAKTGPRLFRRVGNKIMREILVEWINMKTQGGLGAHFQQEFATTLGYSERGRYYERRKFRRTGRVDPFVSPSRASLGGGHMRDQITNPGSGYRMSARQGQTAAIRITFPAARKLNLITPPYGAKYRAEFLRLNHPVYGRADREWILGQLRERLWPAVHAELAKHERIALNARSRLNTRLARIAA